MIVCVVRVVLLLLYRHNVPASIHFFVIFIRFLKFIFITDCMMLSRYITYNVDHEWRGQNRVRASVASNHGFGSHFGWSDERTQSTVSL
jgi:hypothetical protein